MSKKISHKFFFVFRFRLLFKVKNLWHNLFYKVQGMKIGANTYLPKIQVTWPHQVSIGDNCILEKDIYFKFDGIWNPGPSIIIGANTFIGRGCEFNISEKITVGDNCLIASGVKFIDHDHSIHQTKQIRGQKCISKSININKDVWIGFNVMVLKGVTIGEGAVIASGAVLNKSVGPFEIWAGIPAKKIGIRKIENN